MPDQDGDSVRAAAEAVARRRLLDAGGGSLPKRPWLGRSQPPSAADLVQLALWRAGTGAAEEGDVLAALTLLPAARAEMDQIEAAMLFVARSSGLSWARISAALGLGSAQAAQQRFDRVTARAGDPDRA